MNKVLGMMLMVTLVTMIVGCQTASQPGRTNSQVTTVDDASSIVVDQSVRSVLALPEIPKDGYTPAAFAQMKELVKLQCELSAKKDVERVTGDVFTQNQMIENSGSEANNPTATSTPSVTTPIDVSWGNASTSGSPAGSFVSGVNALWNLIRGNPKTQTPAATPPAQPGCNGGSCSE